METKFHSLPPLKRFRLMQQQEAAEATVSSRLPAKKRKESRDSTETTITMPTTSYCFPAKKRVWALPPDETPPKPLSPFDLNVEYKPSFIEEEAKTPLEVEEVEEKGDPLEIDVRQSIGDEDDDGILCAVCQSTDGDPLDPIVLCDGCDLMVHTTCYGNPLIKGIPEGDWFCDQCLSKSEKDATPISCCLCPSMGGAMKLTNDGRWAHVVCALFIPEVFFEDPEGRNGIDCSKVAPRRWEGKCYVCNSSNGCIVNCSELKCHLGFHVTCGLKEDLCLEYKEGKRSGAIVAGFCKEHTELWKKQQQTGKFKIVAREEQNIQ